MDRIGLARKLVASRTAAERKRLLVQHLRLADVRLAHVIKDICYEAWTSKPTVAQKASASLKSLQSAVSNDEIDALSYWVSGISNITRGKLEDAVLDLNRASRVFVKAGNEHESAQPQVAALIALAMLGRYGEAAKTGKAALKKFEKYHDQLAAGKIEMNLSNIVSRRGLHREAEKYCLSAYKRFSKLRETTWRTMAENGLANTYAELNDFRTAEKYYSAALKSAHAAGMLATEAEIEASMGNLAVFRGRYSEALNLLELSRRTYESLAMPHQTAIAELEIAGIYAELNLNDEALEIYKTLVGKLHRLKLRGEEAQARANFGKTAILLNRASVARRELQKASALFKAERNDLGVAEVDLTFARLEFSQKRFRQSLIFSERAAKVFRKSGIARHELSAKWMKAEALSAIGRYGLATKTLEQTLDAARLSEQRNIAQASLNSLGKLAGKSGDFRRAERLFKQAVKMIEKSRAPLPAEEFRMAFFAGKLEPYENLSKLYLANGRIRDAFLWVEKARSRSLLEEIESEGRTSGGSTKLRREAETLREELNWFYSRMERAAGPDAANLRKEVRSREKRIVDLSRQIGSTSRTKTALSKTADLDIKALQNQVGPQRALIEFIKSDGVFSAFVITDKKIEFVEKIAAETEILSLLEGMRFQFGVFRYGANAIGPFSAQLHLRTDAYLTKLFDKLLRPLKTQIADRDLVIVSAGVLHYVPFHALKDGDEYLIESREVTYSPGAAVWQKLDSRPQKAIKRQLLMGVADEQIPLVEREIKALKKIFPAAKSLIGKSATFSAFSSNQSDFDLIHLACHGQFRPDNPMFSSLHLSDGWVTVRDICSQKIKAELVTLSACETGLNKIYGGDEVIGLARGFISAGAASLLLSLWTVNDEAAMRLMKEFYKNLQRGRAPAASLRIAQRKFIRRGEHPYFWSPFCLIGR